jgi:DNA-binding transcriptional LysR family regulator
MDLRKLEIFVRVAEFRNFSRAATSLHMAQPAVSIAIRKLEEELDVCVFDRRGRQTRLTAEGKNLLQRARVILREVEDLKHSTSDMKHLLQGELTVASPSMLATYFLPDLLSRFLGDHPGLRASVTQAGTRRVEEMLLADEIEIGVTTNGSSEDETQLELLPLVAENMVVCMSAKHRWAGRRQLKLKDLHHTPMVVYESGYFIRNTLDELCAEQGVSPEYRMQTNFLPLMISMVKQGLGTTVGLRMMADTEPGIVGVSLIPRVGVNMALARRRGSTVSRANQAFWDWVKSAVNNQILN